MPTIRRSLAAFGALLLVAALAACAADGPFSVKSTGVTTIDEPIPAWVARVRFRVEMFNGPIEVRAGAAGTFHAVVETSGVGASQSEAAADRAEISVTRRIEEDGTIVLAAVYMPRPTSPGNRSASAVVEVPADAVLDLHTSNGAVSTSGIGGAVEVQTSNGAVTLVGVTAGATVRTSNGHVEVDGGGPLDIETSNGLIAIRATDATVRAETSNADVTFAGSFSDGAQRLVTSNSSITVRLPAGASFELDAETSNAGITLDGFSIHAGGAAAKGSLRGTVGSGGPSLELRTSNNAIVVAAE